MRRLVTTLVCVVLVGACRGERGQREACPEGSAAPKGSAGVATLTTTPRDHAVGFVELPKASIRFDLVNDRYTITFYSFPEGTGATVGDRVLLTSPSAESFDLRDALGELPAERAFSTDSTIDPKLDVELRVPGFAPTRLRAPALPTYWALRGLFSLALEHPVLFSGEKADDPPRERPSLAVVGGPDALFGEARTVREVDRVALVENLTAKPARRCDRDVQAIDQEVVVVERRTARVVARRVFRAQTDYCPTGPSPSVYPDLGQVRRWLRDEVMPLRK